jgi:hypothetical protein
MPSFPASVHNRTLSILLVPPIPLSDPWVSFWYTSQTSSMLQTQQDISMGMKTQKQPITSLVSLRLDLAWALIIPPEIWTRSKPGSQMSGVFRNHFRRTHPAFPMGTRPSDRIWSLQQSHLWDTDQKPLKSHPSIGRVPESLKMKASVQLKIPCEVISFWNQSVWIF